MAIYRLLENTAFGPEDIERLVTAYGQTLRALGLKDRDDALTQLVAAKIIAVVVIANVVGLVLYVLRKR